MSSGRTHRHSLSSIFSSDAKPVWTPPTTVMHKTLPGWFPTSKCPAGMIRYRLPLMAAGLMHIDTDPQVTAIAPYPAKVSYGRRTEKGELKKYEHIPDLAIRMKDGSTVFIDFVPYRISAKSRWYQMREHDLREYFSDLYDCHYSVLDERSIHAQPLFDNIKTIWSHKAVPNTDLPIRAIRDQLHTLGMPEKLGTLIERLEPSLSEGVVAPTGEQPEPRNVAFASLMHLVITGDLEIELDRPISASSIVSRYGSLHK